MLKPGDEAACGHQGQRTIRASVRSTHRKPTETFPRRAASQGAGSRAGSHRQAGELLSCMAGWSSPALRDRTSISETHRAPGKSPAQVEMTGRGRRMGTCRIRRAPSQEGTQRYHSDGHGLTPQASCTCQLQKAYQESLSHFSTSKVSNQNLPKVHSLFQMFRVLPRCLSSWGTQRRSGSLAAYTHPPEL